MNGLLMRTQSELSGQIVGWVDLDLRRFSHFRYDPTRDGDSDSDSDDTNSDSTDSGEGEGDQVKNQVGKSTLSTACQLQ